MKNVFSIKDADFSIGGKSILRDINLDVPEGEISTIVGPNGAGKTTLVNLISRVIKPCSGSVYFMGRDISLMKTKEIAKRLAVLPQVKHPVEGLSVEALISYGRFPHSSWGMLQSRNGKEIVEWALEKTHTKHLRKRNILSLSGGEQQRAWLGMALVQSPEVLILDEPTAFLDIAYQLEILELVKSLNRDCGLTVIMVLHDLNHALRYSDRVIILNKGKVVKTGETSRIFSRENLEKYFSIDSDIQWDETNSCPFIIPHSIVHHKEAE